jgi:hypothetical protein
VTAPPILRFANGQTENTHQLPTLRPYKTTATHLLQITATATETACSKPAPLHLLQLLQYPLSIREGDIDSLHCSKLVQYCNTAITAKLQ